LESISTTRLSAYVKSELRASHAGETGAVWIYRGVLAVNWLYQDRDIDAFAYQHLQTEKQHLQGFEDIIHHFRGSLLLFFWAVAGFLTGAIPSLLGKNYVYYTIYSVEAFVDEHYAIQLEALSKENHPWLAEFLSKMSDFHADEKAHKLQALDAMTKPPTLLMKLWGKLVAVGSGIAVKLARLI